jgi:hypothetical protein
MTRVACGLEGSRLRLRAALRAVVRIVADAQ